MKKHIMPRALFWTVNLVLFILLGLLAGCPRKQRERGVTAPVRPPAVVLNVAQGAALRAKVTGLTVVVADQASGAVADTQVFADPAFPLNLEVEVEVPPCLYVITAVAVLGDGSTNSASANVDACAFAGGAITLAIVTEEPTPRPTMVPTLIPTPTGIPTLMPTPTGIPTLMPTPTGIPTLMPTPTETPVPLIPTATPTETPVPPTATPTETPVPPTATPTETPVPPTPTETPIPACSGVLYAGYCWYLGDGAQNCDDWCSSYGGYDPGTCTYAGLNQTNCDAVLTALGVDHSGTFTSGGVENNGCIVSMSGVDVTNWAVDAGCLSSAASGSTDWHRVCACNN